MTHDNLPVRDQDPSLPVPDPGLPEHIDRFTDVDEGAGNRAYRAIMAMLIAAPILAALFVASYFAIPKDVGIDFGILQTNALNLALGAFGGLAVLCIGLSLVQWARVIMDDKESVEQRWNVASDEKTRALFTEQWEEGVEQSGIRRRPLLGGALAGAIGISVVPALVLLADMGPWPTRRVRAETIERTIWAEGVRIVNDVTYEPIRAEDIEIGQLVNAEPENLLDFHGTEFQVERAKAALIVVRMPLESIIIPETRRDWQVGGVLAYSKICTHVGCPISLWERQTHHLLCPCHQSTFDLANSGVVVFGPAARALPQLPIKVNDEGYLVARSDFTVPVGPSFWERDSKHDFQDGDQ